jgi:hypothetical protein
MHLIIKKSKQFVIIIFNYILHNVIKILYFKFNDNCELQFMIDIDFFLNNTPYYCFL